MLAALLFYGFLFFGLVLLPAGLIASVLAFFEFERRVWHGELPWVHPIAKLISGSRFATAVEARFPKSLAFIARRSDPRNPWGLPATAATVVFCAGAWFFFRVWHGISSHGPLVLLDMRLHNIVPLFRTEWMTRVMLLWTQLAGGSTLTFLCLGSGLLALAARKRRLAATFVLALVGTGLLSTVLKLLFNTGRPLDAIISAQQGSFPSGHMLSGTVFYGLLAALVLRSRHGPLLRAMAVTLLLLVIVGIGLSRIYLGVHWPSDILGSLALALMLLSALLFFLHDAQPVRWVDTLALPENSRALGAAGIAALVLAAVAAATHSERTDILEIEAPAPTRRVTLDALRNSLPPDMGRWSEDFLGGRMEPISLVIVGNEQQIEGAFRLSGWERADLPTPVRVLQEGLAALGNQPDPKGPATPAFLGPAARHDIRETGPGHAQRPPTAPHAPLANAVLRYSRLPPGLGCDGKLRRRTSAFRRSSHPYPSHRWCAGYRKGFHRLRPGPVRRVASGEGRRDSTP